MVPGATVILLVVCPPGIQVKLVALELTVKVAVLPEQMAALATERVGVGDTVTLTVWVPEHKPLVPFTVYTVLEAGETEIVLVVGPEAQV